jgi:hypothetical protein
MYCIVFLNSFLVVRVPSTALFYYICGFHLGCAACWSFQFTAWKKILVSKSAIDGITTDVLAISKICVFG